jgi:hypothetical protein
VHWVNYILHNILASILFVVISGFLFFKFIMYTPETENWNQDLRQTNIYFPVILNKSK